MNFTGELLHSIWNTGTALAPSLFLGLLIAGLLHVFVKRERIFRHMGKPGFSSVLKASILGVPLPLCSCGVLPAALSLRRDGASRGAVVSFLASTPQTGVDSIAPTWALLGWPVALAKVLAAFLAGIISGSAVDMLEKGNGGKHITEPTVSNETGSVVGRIWKYSFWTLFRDIHRWLFAGIVISALITVFIEPGELAAYPLLSGPLGMLAALAVGIPLYVCSVSSIPIAAALVHAGFPVGSAVVFLMAGPVTNAATMGAVRKELGKVSFLSYVITVIIVSLLAGLFLNGLEIPAGIMHHHNTGGAPLSALASILLFTGILYLFMKDIWKMPRRKVDSEHGEGIVYTVGNMTCGNCARTVRDAIAGVRGVEFVDVSLEEGSAVVHPGPGFSSRLVLEALDKAGHPGKAAVSSEGCSCDVCERN